MRLHSTAILLVWMATATPVSATTQAAVVRFGTACAHCHEGECSGRLSFSLRPQAAFAHIRRYAGPTNDELARQLYDTLEEMKSDCRYPPLAAPNLDQTLTATDLEPYLDPWSGDYFLPLGSLEPGSYTLEIDFDGGGRVRIEALDSEFEPLIDRCLTIEAGRQTIVLLLSHPSRCYLRLRPRGPMRVQGLRLLRSR